MSFLLSWRVLLSLISFEAIHVLIWSRNRCERGENSLKLQTGGKTESGRDMGCTIYITDFYWNKTIIVTKPVVS